MLQKFLLTLLLCFFISLSNAYAQKDIKILVNNVEISSDVSPFIVNGTTYVPIRFISHALKVDKIEWNQNSQAVTIKNGKKNMTLFVNKNYGYIDNAYTKLPGSPILKNSRTFVPLRLISETFESTVNWDSDNYIVTIKTKSNNAVATKPSSSTSVNKPSNNKPSSNTSTTKPSNNSHSTQIQENSDKIYWLSRIIEAEASGEPYKGKVAVGEVILNRVESKEFPNTIWKVIFDDTYAIQFEPVANGTIYNTPSDESIKAAKEALRGSNYVGESLYFLNPKIAVSNWITKNRDYYATIANHDFYL